MKRELASVTLTTAALLAGTLAGFASVGDDAAEPAPAQGMVKDLDAHRELMADPQPQSFVIEDGVSRTWGANRYATAAAIAKNYGWTYENTVSVYIATGEDYADALTLGPSILGDGPLLLVKKDKIPGDTRRLLSTLQPCFIHVVGGDSVIDDTVYQQLKDYVNPDFCQG